MAAAPRLVVGRISGVHGVAGWLRVHSYTRPPAEILDYSTWYLDQDGRCTESHVRQGREQSKGIVALLSGCENRTVAESWIGAEITIERAQLAALDDHEYYWTDLIGCRVCTVQGEVLGDVTRLMETGGHDVLVVNGQRERLIPFVPDVYIRAVDIADRCITVDWDLEI